MDWLMISYRIPTEPSALRVAVWRALKSAGAVKLGDATYLLPHTPACESALQDVVARIQAGGGTALSWTARGLAPADDGELTATFQGARFEEFEQVGKSARRLIEHIEREVAGDDYRFAEVDALEEELEKVRRQHQRAVDRDHLSSPARETAALAVSDAARRLRDYLDEAFRRDNGLDDITLQAGAGESAL
jgi:hypothetical protein